MNAAPAIAKALDHAGLPTQVQDTKPLSGGCIFNASVLTLAGGQTVVAKVGSESAAGIFEEEFAGLRALAQTHTVRVPEPLATARAGGAAALLMTYIEPGSADADGWRTFGGELAQLHRTEVGSSYGFDMDNHLGSTPQPNGWMDDWVQFNVERRLGHQARLAKDSGVLHASELQRIDDLCASLDRHIPRRPRPALLHGDLWSGNALPTADGRIAVIDPAVSIGDGWADIAMMKLFGGFHPECFEAYAEAVEDNDDHKQRIAVYQLYHVLNHCNLFGRGYAGRAMALLSRLGH